MLEELQRRHYSENTTRSYLRTVEDFARRFHCPPDRLGPPQIREYQAELFQKHKSSAQTVAARRAALRFFYTKTLHRSWSVAETPYPKKTHRLPTILSQREVAQLIDAATSPLKGTNPCGEVRFYLNRTPFLWPCPQDLSKPLRLQDLGRRHNVATTP